MREMARNLDGKGLFAVFVRSMVIEAFAAWDSGATGLRLFLFRVVSRISRFKLSEQTVAIMPILRQAYCAYTV